MKRISLIIFISLINISFCLFTQAQTSDWEFVLSDPEIDIYDIFFLQDAQNGWAVGYGNFAGDTISAIYKTSDGGLNWERQVFNDSSSVYLTGIFFIDSSYGWMIGNLGRIYFSINGGNDWEPQNSGTNRLLSRIHFINSNEGWVTGGYNDSTSYLVLHTTNGGNSWENLSFGSDAFSCESLFFLDAKNGWIGGISLNPVGPHIHYTNDGGKTWSRQNPYFGQIPYAIKDIEFVSSKKGWATTRSSNELFNGPILYTENGGINWTIQTYTGLHYHELAVRDSMNIAVIGLKIWPPAGEKIFVTTNGGQNWDNYSTPIIFHGNSIDFVDENIWMGAKGSKILKSTNYGITWEYQKSSTEFSSIGWKDSLTGYVASGKENWTVKYCFKTTDGGFNWFQDFSAPGGKEIFFIDSQNGFMLWEGYNPSVWRTTNGGTNWTEYNIESNGNWIVDIFFASPDSGWACGANGTLRFTSNAGMNWLPQTSGEQYYISRVFFVNTQKGWIAGGYGEDNGFIRYTTNGGQNWLDQATVYSVLHLDIFFINEFEGWATTIGGLVQRTTDGGNSWLPAGNVPHDNPDKIYMLDSNRGWLLANFGDSGNDLQGHIYYTSDGGNNWNEEISANWPLQIFNDIKIKPNGTLWVCGSHSTILKNNIVVSVENFNPGILSFTLGQNYPNPFNPITKIKYSIAQPSFVVLKVFDILGNEIETLVNEEKPSGVYEVEFNASNLSSGIYFYQLKAGDFISTKKLVLLK